MMKEQFVALKGRLLSNASFTAVAQQQGLQRFMTKLEVSDIHPPKTMADTLEAIVGAAYLDGGMDAAKTVTVNLGALKLRKVTDERYGLLGWPPRSKKTEPFFFSYSYGLLDHY